MDKKNILVPLSLIFVVILLSISLVAGMSERTCVNSFCSGFNSRLTDVRNGVGVSNANLGAVCCDGAWWADTRGSNWDSSCNGKGSGIQEGGWYVCNNFGSLTGKTDSFGNLNFRVNPGTYNWQVSKTGYITKTENILVNKDMTLYVVLASCAQTCTSFTYSAWSTCINGIQTRTVTSSFPAGCTGGNPILTQTCTPLCTESDWIYTLSPTVCPSTGLQTKTWTKIGSCSGGVNHPSTEIISCTPNVTTCTSFNYTNWSTCINGIQTRVIISSFPINCTGGNPITTQQCNVTGIPQLNVPDQYLSENSGYNNNIINLKDYTNDTDTPISRISYSIISQSNISVVNCSIDSSKYLDCNVKNNTLGFSEIVISISDGVNNNTDSFKVYIEEVTDVTKVRFIYPVGGEKLSGNVNILWNATNSKNHALLISLYYSIDNGSIWNVLKENETNDGSYNWNTKIYPNGTYLLKIKAFDLVSGISVFNQTQKEFSVNNTNTPPHHPSSGGGSEEVEVCEPLWQCSGWSDCFEGIQTKTCEDINSCDNSFEKPSEMRICEDYQTGNIMLSLEDAKKKSLGEKIFCWIIFLGLLLILLLIILVLILLFRKSKFYKRKI